ncbi:ADP-ribosylglycohydrolase family protein [Nesterenkonia lutea]|uniref:DUF222 domain-containing protein n=1 Tax=Nesterenkonia lutea TaxID=272919 RepID=A0ABR9JD07_9MICC|nr:ADP-ribosylglycohydrolase family protein [Nesterenkonia lutea]MBE1523665.1 hypothetical protein [Nesterenkonia lutea]
MDSAEKLISRFRPVLRAGASPASSRDDAPAEHAELLHQLCTADGLLELLDWTRQGLGADPLACMWLGSLRWYRVITGSCPASAPQPPTRVVDEELLRMRREEKLPLRSDSASGGLAGLSAGEMAYPSAPAQPESADARALLRAVPVGLVPYIDEPMRRAWARQTVALTHGHPELLRRAEELAMLVHELASAEETTSLADRTAQSRRDILEWVDDAEIREILQRQLDAATDPGQPAPESSGGHRLAEVIDLLAQQWEEVTRPR